MSSHAAGKRSLPKPRKVRFLDSTIDLGSIVFGAVIVSDVSGGAQTYYRFIILAVLFLIAWVRAHKQDQPPLPACWTAFKDVAILTCLGLASFAFSLATDPNSPALVNWTVSILLAVPFVLVAHGIRHRKDQEICFIPAVVMLAIAAILTVIDNTLL